METRARPPVPIRLRRPEDGEGHKPLHAVWELTMKCDQACDHCGSRAGPARPSELSTEECFEVGRALARLGCREVALIGGEAYLRHDIHEIIRFLVGLGLRVVMQSGGRTLTAARARALKEAGLSAVGISVDGPASVHDRLRGNLGSHRAAIHALDAAREAGLVTTGNTQINRLNHLMLREICAELRAHGIQSWQVQLTVPMGRAADRPEWIIEPAMVVDILRTLAEIQVEAAKEPWGEVPFNVVCGNNLGYFGPHEVILRSRPGGVVQHWGGCKAGVDVIGIESDGTIKGCPSLPTAPYAGGNVRDLSLEQIWEHSEALRFARERSLDELWGFCRTCYYAEVCKGGCSWMAHCTLGRRGNNPFCYHRVVELGKRGIRERLSLAERAPDRPYDFGRFEIVEEPWT
ncbi:radical SAM/SPASM domain-containing protein [Sorangium cellulosum]|uniref:Radical SAM/SPASM domain-containing protein n=1 Tax=Sorangium cellulosum TaxID=56 RepID=A0A4P2Q9P2_SORCE|nr:radical SAM protein [Sorangium cellulosum]AUX26347.1 radical SAM/SPASM domain-containing protein [Sorangium cellulosum]